MEEIIPVGRDVATMTVAGDWLIWADYRNGLELYDLVNKVGGPATSKNGMADISGLTNDGEMLTAVFWKSKDQPWSRNSIVQINLEELIREGAITSKVGMSPEVELPDQVRAVVKDENGVIYLGAEKGIARIGGEFIEGIIDGSVLAMAYDPVNQRLFAADYSEKGDTNKVVVLNLRDGTHRTIQEDLRGFIVYSLAYKDDTLFVGVCGNKQLPKGGLLVYDLKEDKVKSRLGVEGKIFPSALAFHGDDLLIASNATSEDQGGILNLGNASDL